MEPRKISVGIYYNGHDVSENLSPYLKSFSYTDSMDESDSFSISNDDRDKKWISEWFPVHGDKIATEIHIKNWNSEGENIIVDCGEFIVDDFSLSGPVHECQINGVSAPVTTDFKETKRTKTWEKVTVRQIAMEIANRYGITLVYDTGFEFTVDRQEQNSETDSSFLKNICNNYGFGIKIYSSKLIIWSHIEYDKKKSAITIEPTSLSGKWSFKSSIQGTYTGAHLSYTNAKTKKGIEISVGTQGRVLELNEKAESEADAIRICENKIWNANRKEVTLNLSVLPNVFPFASQNATIKGFGKIDGKYRIEKVTHQISGGQYSKQVVLSLIHPGEGV